MQTFENTVMIQRPAEEVFAFLADFENIPKWNYAIDETHKISAGPIGVGTRYRQTRSVPSRSVEGFVFELVALAWIRWRFFATGFLRSFISIAIGGAIIASVSAALGAVS